MSSIDATQTNSHVTDYVVRAISDSRGWLSIPIAEPDFVAFKAAQNGLMEATLAEEKLNLVVENFAEFEQTLVEIAIDDSIFQEHDHIRGMDRLHRVTRRLMNLLSTGRTYVDQSSVSLKRFFGRKSAELTRFEEQLALLRSNDRFHFAEELRNHAQHCGLPVHVINSHGDHVGEGNGWRNRFRVTASISLEELCQDPRFRASKSPLLQGKPDGIDVRLIVRTYVAGLGLLHETVRLAFGERIPAWELAFARVERLTAEVANDAEPQSACATAGETVLDRVPFFPDMNERRRYLERRNIHLATLDRRFVSSEADEPA